MNAQRFFKKRQNSIIQLEPNQNYPLISTPFGVNIKSRSRAARRFKSTKAIKMQPLPSPHCAASLPRMASLPNAPWSGRDLAQTAHTDAKRSKREMQLAGILESYMSSPRSAAVCPYSSQPAVSVSPLRRASSGAEMLPRRLCGLRLVFIVWGGEESAPRFPLLISSGTAAAPLWMRSARRVSGNIFTLLII